MIYTIEYLREEAKKLRGAWNGKTDTFNHEGDTYTEYDVDTAEELLEKLDEVESLAKSLRL